MKIFLLDVNKQLLSSGTVHLMNVFISIFIKEKETELKDECSIYLVSFLLDITLGVFLTILLLKLNRDLIESRKGNRL